MCHIWYDIILLNDIINLHVSSLGTLVPRGPYCVFYATRHQAYWGLTHGIVFASALIWYHTHKQTHTAYSGAIDWHTRINIYYHHLLCAHSSYLYYIEWIIAWYQKFTLKSSTMSLLFKNNWFIVEVTYLLIRLISSHETQRMLIDMV